MSPNLWVLFTFCVSDILASGLLYGVTPEIDWLRLSRCTVYSSAYYYARIRPCPRVQLCMSTGSWDRLWSAEKPRLLLFMLLIFMFWTFPTTDAQMREVTCLEIYFHYLRFSLKFRWKLFSLVESHISTLHSDSIPHILLDRHWS